MQPTLRQVPPKVESFSTTAVFSPSCAARMAHTSPPGPVPMTMRSYATAIAPSPICLPSCLLSSATRYIASGSPSLHTAALMSFINIVFFPLFFLHRCVKSPNVAERIAKPSIAGAPKCIVRRHDDRSARAKSLLHHLIDVLWLVECEMDRNRGAPRCTGCGGAASTAHLGKIIREHQRAVVDFEFGMHDTLAVLGEHQRDLFGIESLFVEFDGFESTLHGQVRHDPMLAHNNLLFWID